jgi:hypothetical protein
LSRNPSVQLTNHEFTGPLQWIEPPDRTRVWAERIAPRLSDNPSWVPPRDAPGNNPYVCELWKQVNGSGTVLVINDHD